MYFFSLENGLSGTRCIITIIFRNAYIVRKRFLVMNNSWDVINYEIVFLVYSKTDNSIYLYPISLYCILYRYIYTIIWYIILVLPRKFSKKIKYTFPNTRLLLLLLSNHIYIIIYIYYIYCRAPCVLLIVVLLLSTSSHNVMYLFKTTTTII
jgi:hypothetical protein